MFQIKWLWENLKGYRKRYVFALCLSVVAQTMYIIAPTFGKTIVDTFIWNDQAAENLLSRRGFLITLCVCIVGFTLLRVVMQFCARMLNEVCSQRLLFKIKNELFNNIQRQDPDYFDKNTTGDLMNRLTGDLEMVRHTTAWVVNTLLECCTLFLTSVVYFFWLDPLTAVCVLGLTPAVFIVSNVLRVKIGPLFIEQRERLSGMNARAQENIAGNRAVRAFAREEHEKEMFREKNLEYNKANKDVNRMWLKFFPWIEGSAQGIAVVQLLAGGLFVMSGRITAGDFVAFGALIWTVSNPMRLLGNLVNDLSRFMASSAKIIEVYFSRPFIVDRADAIDKPERFKGEIEFRNVTFKYGGKTVLDNVSFKINPGETAAFMGGTGSGKTTLVNLISRFGDPCSGEVLVDGVNVRMLKLGQLRKNIGTAMQDVMLWSDTIDGNIAFSDVGMPEEDVALFAKAADADGFIEELPDGYQTIVGERGVGLSGGQKQRVSFARAMAVRPSVLILDDVTSAVDLETERRIRGNLNNLDFECTKIIIAQRVSSAAGADKIIILKNGKIDEMGTHEELLKNPDGYYSEIYNLQHGVPAGGAA
jgi:ATP-binding cassette subfamily B protein